MYLGLWACWQFVLFWSVALIEVGFRDGMKYPRRYLPAGQGKTPHEYKSVSRNGIYKIYDHMHVAFPRIIPRIMPPNHTRESYHESYPWFWSHVLKHPFEFVSRDDLVQLLSNPVSSSCVRQCHQNDLVHKMCIFWKYLTQLYFSIFQETVARPNHTSETYLESYPLMQHALLTPEFSERTNLRAIVVHAFLTELLYRKFQRFGFFFWRNNWVSKIRILFFVLTVSYSPFYIILPN